MKNKNVKIAMVGGGSYGWMPKLVSDLVQTPEMEGCEVFLLDPDIRAAREVKAAAVKIATTFKKRFRFVATSNEDTTFRGADFVVITVSTGGLEMMRHDLSIPDKYRIYQTVGDSVGPGGWSRTLRNVPVFARMARKIERLAPNAIVLNYTNPMASLTGAITAVSSLRAVGLCHGVFGTVEVLEGIFGVKEKDIALNFCGVNHFFWLLEFRIKGQAGYPLLRKALKGRSLDRALASTTDPHGFSHANHLLCDELLKAYGHLTYVGDRHTCEFFNAYLTDKAVMERFKLVRTSIADRYAGRERARKKTLEVAAGKVPPPRKSRETAVNIMKSFLTNKPFVDVVNLPNVGQIDNLPRGAVVETLGLVNARGFSPIAAGAVPQRLLPLVEPHCRVQQMTLEAALKGDKDLALQALMLDPLCTHLAPSDIRKMGMELMEATKEWLPQF
ncbi:MAG: hypothetical protein A2498_08295 [Lentisphaerae bacterium RIFOXYC12_FULL_60_16]|nr:MAG: hypothetical protein A2498_08295 [Lentisphaerae bacterium RIFOXYC12_FULL_60_16]OGV83889.1 MAG: hypothetical protein A2340_12255 [Lentisphaerae bacterium RIFOXYB12_FULL_60_10]